MVNEDSQRISLKVGDCSPVYTQERLHEGSLGQSHHWSPRLNLKVRPHPGFLFLLKQAGTGFACPTQTQLDENVTFSLTFWALQGKKKISFLLLVIKPAVVMLRLGRSAFHVSCMADFLLQKLGWCFQQPL